MLLDMIYHLRSCLQICHERKLGIELAIPWLQKHNALRTRVIKFQMSLFPNGGLHVQVLL